MSTSGAKTTAKTAHKGNGQIIRLAVQNVKTVMVANLVKNVKIVRLVTFEALVKRTRRNARRVLVVSTLSKKKNSFA
jgi:hypothetical protein